MLCNVFELSNFEAQRLMKPFCLKVWREMLCNVVASPFTNEKGSLLLSIGGCGKDKESDIQLQDLVSKHEKEYVRIKKMIANATARIGSDPALSRVRWEIPLFYHEFK